MWCNRTQLCGRLEARGTLRFSPTGMALIEFTIIHRSEQTEAQNTRKIDCSMFAKAADKLAEQIAKLPLGAQISAEGFLAKAGRDSNALVLHVQNIELIER